MTLTNPKPPRWSPGRTTSLATKSMQRRYTKPWRYTARADAPAKIRTIGTGLGSD